MSSLISLILYIFLAALFAGVLYFVVYKAVKRAVIEANEELQKNSNSFWNLKNVFLVFMGGLKYGNMVLWGSQYRWRLCKS